MAFLPGGFGICAWFYGYESGGIRLVFHYLDLITYFEGIE